MQKRTDDRRPVLYIGMMILALLLTGCAGLELFTPQVETGALSERGVLIDAGHGGADVGALGVSGAEEDKLNLSVAQLLKEELEQRGIPVAMTRETHDALAETKDGDMQTRAEIIGSSDAAVFVSIHMNSFPDDPGVWGPQVFYQRDSRTGEAFAKAIQPFLNEVTGGTRKPNSMGLFVLKAASMPAVLVECGFLSNAEEEQKLQDEQHQKKLVKAIVDGIEAYCR